MFSFLLKVGCSDLASEGMYYNCFQLDASAKHSTKYKEGT